MHAKKLISHVSDSHDFRDAYLYYRFKEDMDQTCVLANFNAGNGSGTFLGQGGCKWSICPHTAHNSYILDIRLSEEIERAVAGASIETRARAFGKLRARVKEQAEVDAPDWILTQSTEVNSAIVSVFQKKRPNGNFKNVKITGLVAESPKKFISGVMDFKSRKQWESNFLDGVIVETINLGEPPSPILNPTADPTLSPGIKIGETPSLPKNIADSVPENIARKTDDVITFLQTVDLAGVPSKMPIAFLNDPERQHALAHLRKQMMLSNPEECMLCQSYFETNADIRFCPCCAMVSCISCVSKRVFEVVSRQVVSVCIHCHRESSRIRHPPDAVQNTTGIDSSVHGKWWRPEELGIVDYSSSISASLIQNDMESRMVDAGILDPDKLEITNRDSLHPLVAGLLDDEPIQPTEINEKVDRISYDTDDYEGEILGTSPVSTPLISPSSKHDSTSDKMARCKRCGEQIPRDINAIESHMEECVGTPKHKQVSATIYESPQSSPTNIRTLGGIIRRSELALSSTRIIYRNSKGNESDSSKQRSREVCALQDSFMDSDGTCYVYEVSVRHCEVRGIPDYITADVLSLIYVARPVKGSKTTSSITIISQVDDHDRKSEWFFSLFSSKSSGVAPRREDLIRELKTAGKLLNILPQAGIEEGPVTLEDFEFLAVIGRGGFGKVMQVRHKTDSQIYAMKILKKTELRRRRQVERTQTERTILANVRHPFIVCLHFAFQSQEKLYMVMDFVQGGDFFTLMRKFKRLPEDWVRIYVAEIAMALQHLHDMDVVYRDLKPENILLCSDGHLKLTDFGLSRFFETRPPAAEDIIGEDDVVTRSFCGTEQYMSPEMLLQQGHNYRMDWWCLGLLMHEMISARHPFMGPTHYDTLRNMVTKPPTLDSHLSSKAASVTRNLLIKNPPARLCCRGGIKELKALPFFEGVNWDALYNKTMDGPYLPDIRGSMDISSFESTFTREAPVDSISEAPSTSKSAKGGIWKMFGIGKANDNNNDDGNDVFQGFSFAREDYQLELE